MLGDGAVRIKADGVVQLVVWASNRDGLGVDPGMELDELVRAALHGARVCGDPCSGLRRICGGRRAA